MEDVNKEVSNALLKRDVDDIIKRLDDIAVTTKEIAVDTKAWREATNARLRNIESQLGNRAKPTNGWRMILEKVYIPLTTAAFIWFLLDVLPRLLGLLAAP